MPTISINNAYDLLGWLCSTIEKLSDGEKVRLTRQYHPEYRTRIIESIFDFLKMKAADKEETYEFLTKEQIDFVFAKVSAWVNTDSDKVNILYLLTYLEEYFDFERSFRHFLTDRMSEQVTMGVYRFRALNSNYKEIKGVLIPSFRPIWEKKKIRSLQELAFSPFALLKKYIWISEKYQEWDISHFYISETALRINENEPLIVVASPGQRTSTFKFHCEKWNNENYFFIDEYDENECEKLQSKIQNVLEHAADENAHIVLFPEMLASEKLLDNISDYLAESDNDYPALICLPSTEILKSQEDKIYQNTVRIINGNGEKLTEYHKQHPFCLEVSQDEVKGYEYEGEGKKIVKCYEPIVPDKKLSIFHVNGVGRIGIMVCADVFNPALKKVLFEVMHINLLLVLVFSEGTDAFFRSLAEAAEEYCDVVWCNTCAAYRDPTEQSLVIEYYSAGHKEQKKYQKYYCVKNPTKCTSCASTIKIAPGYRRNGSLDTTEL